VNKIVCDAKVNNEALKVQLEIYDLQQYKLKNFIMFSVLVFLQNIYNNAKKKSNNFFVNLVESTLNIQMNHENKLKYVLCSNVIKKIFNCREHQQVINPNINLYTRNEIIDVSINKKNKGMILIFKNININKKKLCMKNDINM